MKLSWLNSLKLALTVLAFAAKHTATTIDDRLVEAMKIAIENPDVQQLIESLIQQSHASPQADAQTLLAHASPAMVAQAESALVGKIGDGKLKELLLVILPLVLKFI